MTTRIACSLTLVATILFSAAQARAAVPLAKNGRPLAVIVHNGHTEVAPNLSANHVRRGHIRPPADELAHYLRQITGAEFVQVESLAEAGKRPAIVLALVGRVPGAGGGAGARDQAARGTSGPGVRWSLWGDCLRDAHCASLNKRRDRGALTKWGETSTRLPRRAKKRPPQQNSWVDSGSGRAPSV